MQGLFHNLARLPDHRAILRIELGILPSVCAHLMEITFPNPSTPRHDRNPKRRINYGLSGQRELADQGQSWHRSILDLVPRLNKYLRTFGDWGRAEIDEVHLWIFPESDGRWYLGEGFCTLLHLIFATDKEVMNPKWRLASRINKHFDFSWGSNTQKVYTSLVFIQNVKIIDKNILLNYLGVCSIRLSS